MKLKQEESDLFQSLRNSESGVVLLEFFERLIEDECDISKLTVENLEAKKEMAKILRAEVMTHLIKRSSQVTSSDEFK